MPERARLAEREQDEALRRAATTGNSDQVEAPASGLARADLATAAVAPGPSRATGPVSIMAMQRLAGNRATVQALARTPRANQGGGAALAEDEQAIGGVDGAEGASAMSSQADMTVGTPGGGPSGGSAQPGAGGGAAGGNGGSNSGNRRAGEIAAGAAGSSAAGKAGELAAGVTGSNAAGRAGEIAAGVAGSSASAKAGEIAAGSKGAGASGKAGEIAAGAAGGAAGSGAAGKAGEIAAGKAVGIAAGLAGSSVSPKAGKAGESAAAAAGGAAGAGAAGKAGEVAAGVAAGSAGSNAAGTAGEIAAGAAGGAAGGAPRKAPPPPITSGGGAGAAGGNAIGVDGGPGAGGAAGRAGGNTISVGGGTGGTGGRAGGNAISVGGGAGGGGAGGRAGGNTISVGGGGAGGGGGAAPAPGPAAGPAPAPAAAPTGPGGLPAPETAGTGIDWSKMLADYGPPARTVLELTRIIPGWGMLGGLAADSINFASDMAAIPTSENAELATDLIVFRNIVNIGNNGLGHVLYVNQLVQDGLAGSVVGAEFVPLTAAANETLSTVKVVLDEVMMGTDIVVEVESLYQANHAPTSAEAEQWRSLADGYAANILGDIVNLVLDVISLSSAGAANTAPVQQGRQPLTLAAAFMRNATPNIISAVNGVLGVWLGTLVTEGRHAYVGSPTDLRAQALGLDAAGVIVEAEGSQARMTYDGINLAIDALSAYADDQIAQINLVAETLSGGKSAFELIRDAVTAGLDDMNRKLIMVQNLGAMATDGQANAAAISEACASVLSALDELVLPDVTLPTVDVGDGVVADAAEAIANEAAGLANAAIREAMSSVSESIEEAKSTLRGPVEAAQEKADSLGEWLALLATECTNMIGVLSGHIATFSEGLGRCTSVEGVIDLIIGQVSDLTGMPRITVAEVREAWQSVGPYIDQFIALGPRMHARASDLRAQADLIESGGGADSTAAPPPEPPPSTGGGAPPAVPPAVAA